MRPQLADDDIAQYRDIITRLGRLEQSFATIETPRVVGEPGQPAFQNGWSHFDAAARPVQFYRHLGRVYLEGVIAAGTLNSVGFVLPEEYWPNTTSNRSMPVDANNAFGRVIINGETGTVAIQSASNVAVFLDGVEFRHV